MEALEFLFKRDGQTVATRKLLALTKTLNLQLARQIGSAAIRSTLGQDGQIHFQFATKQWFLPEASLLYTIIHTIDKLLSGHAIMSQII